MLKKATIITWPGILETKMVSSLVEACSQFDVKLEKLRLDEIEKTKSHWKAIEASKNCIAWFCPGVPQEEQKKKANILFFENGLLDRGRSYYLDDNGFGHFSNIVAKRYNVEEYSKETLENLEKRLEKAGWKKFPIIKDKIVMIALQAKLGIDTKMLEKCEKFLPKGTKVILREHPAHRSQIEKNYGKFCERNEGWKIDDISDPVESLSRCRALVVNSSSMMYKALYSGMTVAACERSFNGGSAAVLDCSRNESLLSNIFDFRFNQEATNRLLCGVDKSSVSANSTVEQILLNTNFGNWMKRLR